MRVDGVCVVAFVVSAVPEKYGGVGLEVFHPFCSVYVVLVVV